MKIISIMIWSQLKNWFYQLRILSMYHF